MSWESRGNCRFYILTRRINGKVVREYCGTGERAERAAEDAARRQEAEECAALAAGLAQLDAVADRSGQDAADRSTGAAHGIGRGATGARADLLVCENVADARTLHRHVDRCRVAASFANNLTNLLEPDGRFWGRFTPRHAAHRTAR